MKTENKENTIGHFSSLKPLIRIFLGIGKKLVCIYKSNINNININFNFDNNHECLKQLTLTRINTT